MSFDSLPLKANLCSAVTCMYVPLLCRDVIESEQVFALKILDSNSNFKIFKRSARDRKWKKIVFEGAGKTVRLILTIIGGYVLLVKKILVAINCLSCRFHY